MPNFHICKVINDPIGCVRCAFVADIQLLIPAEYIVSMLPDIKTFGWTCMYINDPSIMPDLKWQNSNVGNTQTLDQSANVTKHKYCP